MSNRKLSQYNLVTQYEKKRHFNGIFGMAFLGLIILGLIIGLLINTQSFKKSITLTTQNYNSDYSKRLAKSLAQDIIYDSNSLQELCNTMERMPSSIINQAFITRKMKGHEYDELFIMNQDNVVVYGLNKNLPLYQWLITQDDLFNHYQIEVVTHQGIAITVPLTIDNQLFVAVALINEESLLNTMVTHSDPKSLGIAIINKKGELLIGQRNIVADPLVNKALLTDLNDPSIVFDQVSGDQQFQQSYITSEGTKDMAIYTSLGLGDIILLTVVPEMMLYNETNVFINNYHLLLGVIGIAFGTLIFLILRSNNRSMQLIESIAFKDDVTQGLNNKGFLKEVNNRLRKSNDYCMIFINVKRFRSINMQYGIQAGNDWIIHFYQLIVNNSLPGEVVTRSDNDHYYWLMHTSDCKQIEKRVAALIDSAANDHYLNAFINEVSFDIGCVIIDDNNDDLLIVQDCARVAAQRHLNYQGVVSFYDADLQKQLNKEDNLIHDFSKALSDNQFEIYLQPKLGGNSYKLKGAEALVRWNHPKYGILTPDEFIPLFEVHHLIGRLDLYVFEKVCQILHRWQSLDQIKVPISVNLSRVAIKGNDFNALNQFFELKQKYDLIDFSIEVESTESIMFEKTDLPLAKQFIHLMHNHGISVSLDDFGRGYSSLSMLKELNVDAIKLDRSFFLNENENTWKIVESFIVLAHQLGMQVVAEGIETQQQLHLLEKYNCDMVQGYVYSKPVPVETFEKEALFYLNQ